MTSPILFVGGEDIDFTPVNTVILASGATGGQFQPSSTANAFRSGYARHAMQHIGFTNGVDNVRYIRTNPLFSSSQFWVTFRLNCQQGNGNVAGAFIPVRLVDSNGVVRLYVKFTAANGSPPNDTFGVFKENAALSSTQLGSNSTSRFSSCTGSLLATPDKIDIFVNYAVSGQITLYLNNTQTFNFTGDLTTDGQTALAGVEFGQAVGSPNSFSPSTYYSEGLVSTLDTRTNSVFTQTATANGNTHNFDGGTAANIAATSQSTGDANPNFSGTAGQINEYQVTPAMPTGNFGVISVVHKIRALAGASGPQKMDDLVRTGGTDYASSDISLGGGWQTYANPWDLNPNTGIAWAVGDLVNASTAFNLGLKSVT